VRNQLACTCKRLPGTDALPIVRELLYRSEDATDPFIPLLLWWAIEAKSISHQDLVLGLVDSPQSWNIPIVHQFIMERMSRRYLAEGSNDGYAACARLLTSAPNSATADLVIKGMDKALDGRFMNHVPAALEKPIRELCRQYPHSLSLNRLALRL